MRTGQLQALQNTRQVKGQPFDAIDLSFGLLTAISASPIAAVLTIGQYFARRSAWVSETLLNAIDLPPALEDTQLVRGILPGVVKLLPASADDLGDDTSAAHQTAPEAPQRAHILSTDQWRDALNESPHLLIYGPSKAGKSTLAQAVVAMFKGCAYVVIDPMPNKPGESKWGGIDFITIDERGADEYASIKAALQRIVNEDTSRRRTMRQQTHMPLVVIIDEVLLLVDALGSTKNAESKTEPRMAQFIRQMGASARHRNIKIILIGQGKNLGDLGLSSGTARNNYALVRAARNAATNARSAFIVADDDEQPIDLRYVPTLAGAAASRARVWLTQADLAAPETASTPIADDLLSSLLNANNFGTGTKTVPATWNEVPNLVPASASEVREVPVVLVPPAEIAKIAQLLLGNAPSKVAKMLDHYHASKYGEYKAKVDAVASMLGTQSRQSDPDRPDPDEGVPPAFREAL